MHTQLAKPGGNELTPYRLVFQSVQVLIPPGRYLLGRESSCCNIILPHDSVAPIHGELIATPTSLQILDRSSEQGVFLNGTRVSDVLLHGGDLLRMGRVQCSVKVEPVAFVDVAKLRIYRAGGESPDEEPPIEIPPSSAATPVVEGLSRDSVEIPANILEQSLFDQLDESVENLPVVPAGNVALSNSPPAQPQTDTSAARPAPLSRQRFAGSDDAPPPRNPYARADTDEAASLWQVLASTTAGRLALLLIVGWGIYGALQVLGDGHAGDREIAARLQHYGDAIGELRFQQAPAEEWSKLRERVDAELPQLVAELERRASSEQPVAQNLLRAARDCLPRMLEPSLEPTWYEERFHEYLVEAGAELAK